MKKYLTIDQADILIEKYYDGETTGAEQERLQEFLQQENLPERFIAERALFGYIAVEKSKRSASMDLHLEMDAPAQTDSFDCKEETPPKRYWLRMNPILKWSFAAAVLLFGVFVIDHLIQVQSSDVAYIDGIRCTDSKEITALALASIEQMDLGVDEVAGTVDKMNDKNLVEDQLQQFLELQ